MIEQLDLGGVLVVEYQQLKEEQRLRIGTRDNLIYATLGSLVLAGAGAAQLGELQILLLIPPMCLVLGWTYLVNDDRVTAIGRYIERSLTPELGARVGGAVFAWERYHREDRGRGVRKAWQLGVDLLTFVLTPAAAVILVAWLEAPTLAVRAVMGAELLVVVLLAYQFIIRAFRR